MCAAQSASAARTDGFLATQPRSEHVLITSAGRRVSLVRNFQSALAGRAKVCAVDMHPELSAACQVADTSASVPRVGADTYTDELLALCERWNIGIIVPTIDTELPILAEMREKLASNGILCAISDATVCETFFSKQASSHYFRQHGFDTPALIEQLDKASYPLFAKRNHSSCSIGAQVVNTPEQAHLLRQQDPDYVFQEFIEGEEYTVDVFLDSKGKAIMVVPRLRLEVRAGEVSKARTVKDTRIIACVRKLCEGIPGAYGVLTVQLFRTQEGRHVFIEINPRFGGGYPLSWKAGADFADALLRDVSGERLPVHDDWRDGCVMLRYDDEIILNES